MGLKFATTRGSPASADDEVRGHWRLLSTVPRVTRQMIRGRGSGRQRRRRLHRQRRVGVLVASDGGAGAIAATDVGGAATGVVDT